MTTNVFNSYSQYYDLLYSDKDYKGEAQFIEDILRRHGVDRGELLELGSGTGKHGKILGHRGYRVHGIELSPEMIARAIPDENFSCQQGDVRTIAMGRSYDAVLSLFHVVSYQTTNSDLLDLFGRASEHLLSDGLFVFDFWYSPAVYVERPSIRIKRMTDSNLEITRIAEPTIRPNENRVDVNYTIFARQIKTGAVDILKETHAMRHFSLPEIDLLAQSSGFVRVETCEFLTGNAVGESTWGACVVLKKR